METKTEFAFSREDEIKKFWEDELKKFWKDTNFSSLDDAIKEAINRAALDFTARTENKRDDVEDEDKNRKLSEYLQRDDRENLTERLKKYFQSAPCVTKHSFDAWHHNTCKVILDRVNEMYVNAAYGKAQKILNMAFKYLYCTTVKEEMISEDYFKYCHMALDSYTLEWIYRNIYPKSNDLGEGRLYKNRTPTWSYFTYEKGTEKDGKEMYSYPCIVDLVRKYFEREGITPFQAEFIIWREIQLEIASEAFYTHAYKYLAKDGQPEEIEGFKKKDLKEKLKSIKKLMEYYCPQNT